MNAIRSSGLSSRFGNQPGARRSGGLQEPRSASLLRSSRQQLIRRGEGESWIVVYMDVITLLLTTFVLILAHVTSDMQGGDDKMPETITRTLQRGIPDGADTTVPETLREDRSGPDSREWEQTQQSPETLSQQIEATHPVRSDITSPEQFQQNRATKDTQAHDGAKPAVEKLAQELEAAKPDEASLALAQKLHESLLGNESAKGLDIKVEPGRINLQMSEKILFPSGQADLLGSAHDVLGKIAPVLQGNDYFISVEGHTDNVPIHSYRFPSNWELSTARASVVLRYLNAQGIPIERLRVIGYADTVPMGSNETVEGRSANRRVTLVIHVGDDKAKS